uniref:ENTH domain-containing protein n=1 Tax=Denticeps clupeoides TaxID=299321 RepID=A0AAY4D5N1_9TELE
MSTFIRRYSRYLNEKAVSYRQVAFDFTKVKRGTDGVMRTMNTEKLLKTIPIIQNQMDALLDFNVNANELTNGVINAAFMLLFKDAIRLFAAYNEGIINLLEKYFDMKKTQCKDGLDIYKKFLTRMTRISEFLKVAEQGSFIELSENSGFATVAVLHCVREHASPLNSDTLFLSGLPRASTLSNAVSSLASTGISFTKVDEREKQAALEEEQARLKALKEQRLKELSKKPPSSATTAASPVSTAGGSISTAPAIDLFSTPSSNSTLKIQNDLLDLQPTLQPAFQPTLPLSTTWGDPFSSSEAVDDSIPNLNPFLTKAVVDAAHLPVVSSDAVSFSSRTPSHEMFGGFSASPAPQPQTSRGLNVDFDSVFGNKSTSANSSDSAGKNDVLGGILKPTVASPNQGQPPSTVLSGKLVSDDLDSSLANLVGNLGIGNGTTKNDIHWSQPGEKKLTGGSNWQPKTAPTTTWNPATMAPSVMAFPATTPTGMMAYGMPPQMGSVAMMTQPTMMYTQPVMRPANPFGPVSGAQVRLPPRSPRHAAPIRNVHAFIWYSSQPVK